jgi:hypothetical protein
MNIFAVPLRHLTPSYTPLTDPAGEKTAAAVHRYAIYLAALPLVTSAAGITSSMFAVESLAFNGYLLYLTTNFVKDTTNANASKVFKCSLWYLPLLMTLMVYHHNVPEPKVVTNHMARSEYVDMGDEVKQSHEETQ